jgi:hypothetical protein
MRTNNKSVFRWSRLAGYLGTIFVILSCSVFSGAQPSDDGLLRLDNNVVEVKDDSGDWVPVGGATVELVGELESTDPWTVAGTTFETRETTQIEAGLEVGDLVKVRGVVVEDDTWVAYSIELAEEQTDPIIILIGTVDSIDPWVVNGITLTVTDETDIQGEITAGMVVRVEILLVSDGTWEVLSIAPLGEPTEISGCATVVATILSVNGNEIQFLGWPTAITLQEDDQSQGNEENSNTEDGEENGNDNGEDNGRIDGEELAPNQVVLAVICVADDGQIVIVQIVVLNVDIDNDNDGNTSENGEKVLVCHKPDKKGGHTLSISSSAVPAHLGHGDTLGACP